MIRARGAVALEPRRPSWAGRCCSARTSSASGGRASRRCAALADGARVDVVVIDAALPGRGRARVGAARRTPRRARPRSSRSGAPSSASTTSSCCRPGPTRSCRCRPRSDWDDRLMRLIHVPVRKTTRFPVNLSVHGRAARRRELRGARPEPERARPAARVPPRAAGWARTCGWRSTCRSATALVEADGTVVRQAHADRFGDRAHARRGRRARADQALRRGGIIPALPTGAQGRATPGQHERGHPGTPDDPHAARRRHRAAAERWSGCATWPTTLVELVAARQPAVRAGSTPSTGAATTTRSSC